MCPVRGGLGQEREREDSLAHLGEALLPNLRPQSMGLS